MQSTTPFSPTKDGRRVLGERDSNACLSPAHQSKKSHSVTGTPVKRTLITNASSPRKLLPSPTFAGQKRTREQVDEHKEDSGHVQDSRGLEQSPQLRSGHDTQHLNEDSNVDIRVPTPSSQPERGNRHDRMEIDRNIASTTQNLQKDTRSKCEDADARKTFIQAKAKLLRTTLQNAMRKVTDHQIDRRVSELEEHSRKQPRLSFPTRSSPPFYKKAGTHSQTDSPQIGLMGNSSSTQPTPDLPAQPFTVKSSDRARKPTRTPPCTTGSPMQLSSPPATVARHGQSRQMTGGQGLGVKGLSPSQRGDAVDGLLKLMNTSDAQAHNTWSG